MVQTYKQSKFTPTSNVRSGFLVLMFLLLTTIAVGAYAFNRVSQLNHELSATMLRVEGKLQDLDAGISFETKRKRLLLGIRDEILRTNRRLSLSEAYEYAALIMAATEKYPSIDPLLLLAVGIVESRYDRSATSGANAKGLYQIYPSTGRALARSLGWEYSREMLHDPQKNTEMAARYLDILLTTYVDANVALAEYNGGPRNAIYFRTGSDRIAPETREYVRRVDGTLQGLRARVELDIVDTAETMYNDRKRDGKRLLASLPAPTTAGN